MTDHALFVVAPYLAAAICVLVGAVRYVLGHLQRDRADTAIRRVDGSRLVVAATRSAIAVIAIGHLLAFAAPRGVLLWDQQLFRLVLLEAIGIVAGSVALAGLAAAHVRQARASGPRAAWPPMDVVVGTLVLMATLSGLFIAVRYRWASSWSGVTVAPLAAATVAVPANPAGAGTVAVRVASLALRSEPCTA